MRKIKRKYCSNCKDFETPIEIDGEIYNGSYGWCNKLNCMTGSYHCYEDVSTSHIKEEVKKTG